MFRQHYDVTQRSADLFHDPGQPVRADQLDWEFRQLLAIYDALQPLRVLEIGSLYGGTLYQWMTHAPEGCHLVSVDLPNQILHLHVPTALPALWQRWLPPGRTLTALRVDSHHPDTVARVRDLVAPLDFVFIDGDHTYAGARQDFEHYGALVRPGGILALHDICAPERVDFGVPQLWSEIQEAGYRTRELRSAPRQVGGGIGVVYLD